MLVPVGQMVDALNIHSARKPSWKRHESRRGCGLPQGPKDLSVRRACTGSQMSAPQAAQKCCASLHWQIHELCADQWWSDQAGHWMQSRTTAMQSVTVGRSSA